MTSITHMSSSHVWMSCWAWATYRLCSEQLEVRLCVVISGRRENWSKRTKFFFKKSPGCCMERVAPTKVVAFTIPDWLRLSGGGAPTFSVKRKRKIKICFIKTPKRKSSPHSPQKMTLIAKLPALEETKRTCGFACLSVGCYRHLVSPFY